MDNSKLNSWLSLVANVAVVGGIIFLAIEIQQNNVLLRSESRQALLANDQNSLVMSLENPDIFQKLVSQEKLSAEDQIRLSFIYLVDIRNREFEYAQYINGLLDEATWQSYSNVILINHSSVRGRKWWDTIGRSVVTPEFGKLVDEMLIDADASRLYEDLSTWDDN